VRGLTSSVSDEVGRELLEAAELGGRAEEEDIFEELIRNVADVRDTCPVRRKLSASVARGAEGGVDDAGLLSRAERAGVETDPAHKP